MALTEEGLAILELFSSEVPTGMHSTMPVKVDFAGLHVAANCGPGLHACSALGAARTTDGLADVVPVRPLFADLRAAQGALLVDRGSRVAFPGHSERPHERTFGPMIVRPATQGTQIVLAYWRAVRNDIRQREIVPDA